MQHDEISTQLHRLGVQPKPKLGQVFLTNTKVIQKQIEFAQLHSKDVVLEVGPGLGVLTNQLANYAGKVIAIEYDIKLYNYLKTIMPDNVELIYGDVLKLELPNFDKLVANIPYQISSPLIFKLIEYDFDLAVIMLQSEFAMKLIPSWKEKEIPQKYQHLLKHLKQSPKHNSRLTIMTAYYFDINYLASVPKTSFYPVPKIDSAIIQLKPKTEIIKAHNEPLFKELIKIVFSERRKMLKNPIIKHFNRLSLKNGKRTIAKKEIKKAIKHLPFLDQRPEKLTLDEFIQLSNELDLIIDSI